MPFSRAGENIIMSLTLLSIWSTAGSDDEGREVSLTKLIQQTNGFFLSWCCTSTETITLIRDGGKGGSGTCEQLVPAIRPVKTEKTVSHRQNNINEVGTP